MLVDKVAQTLVSRPDPVVGTGGGTEPTGTSVDPFGAEGPIFVDGPTTPPKPGVIQIVVPAEVGDGHLDGGATYKRTIGDKPDSCSAPNVPYGAKLTVTNRDNGHFVSCVNRAPQPLAAGIEIALTFTQFSEIGQIVDAPIPVRISWSGSE